MTARCVTDERDPLPEPEWRETSHEWARRQAIEATERAVQAAKDARTRPAGEVAE